MIQKVTTNRATSTMILARNFSETLLDSVQALLDRRAGRRNDMLESTVSVRELMSTSVKSCRLDDSLHRAAQIMWETDCGCVPVVDVEGRVRAMITDRDVCMASFTQNKPLAHIMVSSAASTRIFSVNENDSISAAEELMRQKQVRRVPVVDGQGRLTGLLSLSDLARRAHHGVQRPANATPTDQAIARTLTAICQPRPTLSAERSSANGGPIS